MTDEAAQPDLSAAASPVASTRALDVLLKRLSDENPDLAKHLIPEIEHLRTSRKFGLVFNRHLPESVRLPGHPVKAGVRVAVRNPNGPDFKQAWGKQSEAAKAGEWRVTKTSGRDATKVAFLAPATESTPDWDGPVAASDLVVVRQFGEPVYPGLRPVVDKPHHPARIANGKPDDPWHLVINGENHHALQALQFTHRGKVDLIYIDPPYNTGGKSSWLYNDKYVDTVKGDASSKWLSFMEKRLVAAQELLKDTGAIMVSIGDNEQHRLRMLMDQIYGPQNCVAVLAVEMSTTSGPKTVNAQQGTIVKNFEYVLIYRKTPAFDTEVAHTPLYDHVDGWAPNYTFWLHPDGTLGALSEQMLAEPDLVGEMERLGLLERGRFSMKKMDDLIAGSELAWGWICANVERIARTDRIPVSCQGMCPPSGRWTTVAASGRDYMLTTLESGTEVQIMTLAMNYRTSDDHKPVYGRTVIRGDIWKTFYKDMARVDQEGGLPFSNGKKPLRLIKQLIRWANNRPDTVVVDFFGGSGTTAHAVMSLNAEDGGRRQAILVTNNELGRDEAKAAAKAGHAPGDPAWEERGVFGAVTRPRLSTSVTGVRPTGGKYSDGLAANIEFFDLTYLDESRVSRAKEFEAIAPLLWMQTGATGARIDTEDRETGYAFQADGDRGGSNDYAVLFDTDATHRFLKALNERMAGDAGSEPVAPPRHIFIVTDSLADYERVCTRLPAGVTTHMLYEAYLTNFEINTGGAP